MDRREQISILKRTLLRDVVSLFQRPDVQWRSGIAAMACDLKKLAVPAVIFGGTLRSLMLGRLARTPRFGRPRDLDIVVANANMETLRERLQQHVVRQTRFGGLQLQRSDWHFDLWPVDQTWAIVQDQELEANFQTLPRTTFFNLEAIAVDLWAEPGRRRAIYSGDDRFFEGLIDRTLEINLEDNPFPALCVVRSLVFASTTRFWMGPRLAHYLTAHREVVGESELEAIQHQHYGEIRVSRSEMRTWLNHVAAAHERAPQERVKLPMTGPLTLWDDEVDFTPRLFSHAVTSQPTSVQGRGASRACPES